MENEKKARFNMIDGLIIFGFLALIAGGIWYFANISQGDNVNAYFTVEFIGQDERFAQLIDVGDEVRDAVRNYFLGHVVNVEVLQATTLVFAPSLGEFLRSPVPERYDVYVTIRGRGHETDSFVRVEGQDMRVGQEAFIRGRGFAGAGWVINIWTSIAETQGGI